MTSTAADSHCRCPCVFALIPLLSSKMSHVLASYPCAALFESFLRSPAFFESFLLLLGATCMSCNQQALFLFQTPKKPEFLCLCCVVSKCASKTRSKHEAVGRRENICTEALLSQLLMTSLHYSCTMVVSQQQNCGVDWKVWHLM